MLLVTDSTDHDLSIYLSIYLPVYLSGVDDLVSHLPLSGVVQDLCSTDLTQENLL